MASASKAIGNKMYKFTKPTRWTSGIGAELPEEYKKFWREWKIERPEPVHYIPKQGKYELAEDGCTVIPVQNIPIPLKYPKELDQGLWGGEAVVQGFIKKHRYYRRQPTFWVPFIMKSVVYSEVLNKHFSTFVTRRALNLIYEHYGLDHYLLKTKACDLKSLLALGLKRQILISLYDKTLYPDDPVKHEDVYERYKHYLESYTREEIEWYGLTYKEACSKLIRIKTEAIIKPVPLKFKLREALIEQLKQENAVEEDKTESSSWLSKINPFGKSSTSDSTSSTS